MRVGVLSCHQVVTRGLLSLLSDVAPEVEARPVRWADAPVVDAILYDVAGLALHDADTERLCRVVKETKTVVVAVDRPLRPDLAAEALRLGAVAFVDMEAGPRELLTVLREALAGTYGADAAGNAVNRASSEHRLGVDFGLTPAEVAVLRLIARGATNEEIARRLFISVNTVKTRIRTGYRRLGITHRSEAVAWAIRHGFSADPIDRD